MNESPVHVAVVGGGISGLAAAHRLLASAPPGSVRVTVLEASPRFGGWIRTEEFAGRPVDFGPDSLLVRTPWAAELCRELEIEDELVAPGAVGAFLLLGGKLRTLPAGILAGLPNGPMPFVKSGLLSPLGTLRAGLDLLLPASAPDGDESIGDLVRRRFGSQVLERVIDPLLGGVHAGRCDDLSLAATAPQIAAAAAADRSLLRGLRKTAPPPPPEGTPPRPVFMGPRAGMQRIVDALLERLSPTAELRTGAAVTAIQPLDAGPRGTGPGVRLTIDGDAQPLDVDGLILALPAAPAAGLLAPHTSTAPTTLRALRYATVAQTALAYDPADLPALPPGTGFLVPRTEGALMTAGTFLDQKWPARRKVLAAEGADALRSAVVIKCSAGRIDDRRIDALTDDELASSLNAELADVLPGFDPRTRPLAHRVFRAQGSLPQYAPGHLERMDAVEREVAAALPALTLAGAAYRGTSVPMCIKNGRAAADAQLTRLLGVLGGVAAATPRTA